MLPASSRSLMLHHGHDGKKAQASLLAPAGQSHESVSDKARDC